MDWAYLFSADQWLTILVAFFSTLFGGLITFVVSFALTRMDRKQAEAQRAIERRESRAFLAHNAFVKLLQYGNAVKSLDHTIDQEFKQAHEDGNSKLDPSAIVRELVSIDVHFDPFKTEELSFLLFSGDAQLLGDLIVFEKRVETHQAVAQRYSDERLKLSEFLSQGGDVDASGDGVMLSGDLAGKEGQIVSLKVGSLNQLLVGLVEMLDRDLRDANSLLDRFLSSARAEFGDLFPNLKLEAV